MNRRPAHFRAAFAPLFLVLALIGIGVRAPIPDGYMPSADNGGWMSVQICSGVHPGYLEINLDTGETRQPGTPDPERAGEPCTFAFAAPAIAQVSAVSIPVPDGVADPVRPRRTRLVLRRTNAPSAGNRDPPALI